MKKHSFAEGDWFAVPLQGDGWAVGRIALRGRHGTLLGYFFGPCRASVPALDDVVDLQSGEAVLIALLGDAALRKGAWPILGVGPSWEKRAWPLPDFCLTWPDGPVYRVHYPEGDPNGPFEHISIAREEAKSLPSSGTSSPIGIEIQLRKLLVGTPKSPPQPPPTVIASPSAQYFLFFPSQPLAEEAAAEIRQSGLMASLTDLDDDKWLVLVTQVPAPATKTIWETDDMLTKLAMRHGGRNNGFER